ncbi:T9SS type A sorting domain-containing protein [Mariniflexile sp.]|uniref:T9SS type A sorting domain-containing protein n=1 Tax=Mariniflexile sp. TaxID=1979402 RepID=UPI003567D914
MNSLIPKVLLITLLVLVSSVMQGQSQKIKEGKLNKKQIETPTVKGAAILNTDTQRISLKAEVINGGEMIIEKGFVYSISTEIPSVNDSKIVVEATLDPFEFELENLEANTTYYVRPYVIYGNETIYGAISKVDTDTLSDIKIDLKAKIKTYPNPSTNYISLSGLGESKKYTIYTMQGKEMAKGTTSNDSKIDVRFLANGMYILKLENLEMVKFIKE